MIPVEHVREYFGNCMAKLSVKVARSESEKKELHEFRTTLLQKRNRFVSPDMIDDELTNEIISLSSQSIYAKAEEDILVNFEIEVGKFVFLNPFLTKSIPLERFNSYSKSTLSITRYYVVDDYVPAEDFMGKVFNQLYVQHRKRGIKFDFILTKEPYLEFFERLGYILFPNCTVIQSIIPMVLIIENIQHLQQIGSPFAKTASEFPNSSNSTQWFEQNFRRKKDVEKANLTRSEQLYKLATYLSKAFLKQHFIFNHLSVYEIEKILNFANVLKFNADEYIIHDGEIGNEFFVILIGKAVVQKVVQGKERVTFAELNAGQIFGEIAFISEQPRTADVIATESLQALRFTQSTLKKLMANMPEITSKMLFNLSLVLCDRLVNVNNSLMDLKKEVELAKLQRKESAE